ncbi:MAG: HAD family phosphatase [Defluviitaleaceae bacterium]|nr:HAD family phosphatase [Defluviitaleaceae bacterium]
MIKPKLVIFDMDGLMLDTEPLAIAGWKVVERELSVSIPNSLAKSVIGFNRELCKTHMLEALGQDFDFDRALTLIHEDVDRHFNEHGIPLKPGLIQLLDRLDELGIKKAVATSTSYDRAVHKLSMANIAHRFHSIIGGDMVEHSKPAPDIFLKAAQTCNTDPSDCIVLEDSNPGAEGAYRAGMRVIVVPDLVPPLEITRSRAYAVCDSLVDVCMLISTSSF